MNSEKVTFQYNKVSLQGVILQFWKTCIFWEFIRWFPFFWQCIGKTCFKIGNSKCLQLMAA